MDITNGFILAVILLLQPESTTFVVDRLGRVVEEGDRVSFVESDLIAHKNVEVTGTYKSKDGEMFVITKNSTMWFCEEIEKVS